MNRAACLLFLLAAASCMRSPEPPPSTAPEPGIARTLAESRAKRITDLRYELRFSVPPSAASPVTGRAILRFTLNDATGDLVLDFGASGVVRGATSRGRAIALTRTPDHVVVPAAALTAGANEITIDFAAGNESLNRQDQFLYTLFVPARAHLAFPCFDQPDLKARWKLTLEVPSGWESVTNGAGLETRRGAERTVVDFAETEPLPTYLFAFAAGRFSVETAERGGRTFRMLHRETDAGKVARNRDVIFDLHARSLAWLERYTGIAYPWGKFDFVLVPSFQFGGMEHAGAVFYNAPALLLEPSATQSQHLGRASLIAHETAHMWFGDLVTMRWFDDVWMKEVFANFMAAKIVNPSFPSINHELRFLLAHYPAAYDVDRTPGTNAIRQRLDNLSEAGSLYGAIIYQKAPIVMRQLEGILGEAAFRDGVRRYLDAHRFGNATWPDLIAVLDERTPEDLAAWSRVWVEEAGRPAIATDLAVANGRIEWLRFTQRDPVPGRGLSWNQRLQVTVGTADGLRHFPVRLADAAVDVPEARGLAAPRFVLPSGLGAGYGGFELDRASLAYLLAHLPEIADPLTRGAAWVTIWEQMLDRRAAPSAVLTLALEALPRESDEQNVQRVLNYAEQAYWRFLPAAERAAFSPRLEATLRAGLAKAGTPGLKSAWFSALRDLAQSPATIEWLNAVWSRKTSVPGLTLAEPDYTALASRLALLLPARSTEILDAQTDRITNPDRRQRFLFVQPALSPDQAVRDEFFAKLKDRGFRQREAWVLEALSYLHDPLRARASEQYIPDSLTLLQEIQRTGDIFFPKRWMDATLAGHSSASAAQMVERFVADLPRDYPDRLRRVILSSSDDLFRASGVER